MHINNAEELYNALNFLNRGKVTLSTIAGEQVIIVEGNPKDLYFPHGFRYDERYGITNGTLTVKAKQAEREFYDINIDTHNKVVQDIYQKYAREINILQSVHASNQAILNFPNLSEETKEQLRIKIEKAERLLNIFEGRCEKLLSTDTNAYLLFGNDDILERNIPKALLKLRNSRIASKQRKIVTLEAERQLLLAKDFEDEYSKLIYENRRKRVDAKLKKLSFKHGKIEAKQRQVVMDKIVKEIVKYQRQRYRLERQQISINKIAAKRDVVSTEAEAIRQQLANLRDKIVRMTRNDRHTPFSLRTAANEQERLLKRLEKLSRKEGKIEAKLQRKLYRQNRLDRIFGKNKPNRRDPVIERPLREAPSRLTGPTEVEPERTLEREETAITPPTEEVTRGSDDYESPIGPPVPEEPTIEGRERPAASTTEEVTRGSDDYESPIGPPTPEEPRPDDYESPIGPPVPEGPGTIEPESTRESRLDTSTSPTPLPIAPGPTTKPGPDLNEFQVFELKTMAKSLGLKGYSNMRKESIINLINNSGAEIPVMLSGYDVFKDFSKEAASKIEKRV